MSDFKIIECQFQDVDFEDSFFSSLAKDYSEFSDWIKKKAQEKCLIVKTDKIIGFLYVKLENKELKVDPIQPIKERLKIGTFKISPHGTKLGERFLKKVFDIAMIRKVQEIYVTIFPKCEDLIHLLTEYDFKKEAIKKTNNGIEDVYIKKLDNKIDSSTPVVHIYPRILLGTSNFYLLSIYPKYHTRLFPDSKLNTEDLHIVTDVSHTNSIHKVYIAGMKLLNDFKKGDVLVIYRTKEDGKNAKYNSVATSICVIENIANINDYSESNFVQDISKYSVFTENELREIHRKKNTLT